LAPRSEKFQVAICVRGVGPAESTGKSRVSYWPGGSRCAVAADCRRPRKPLETGGIVVPLLLQDLMDERDRYRPLADCGRHALDVPRPHVPHREYAGATCFEKMRRA
jgi:hypothetical protein